MTEQGAASVEFVVVGVLLLVPLVYLVIMMGRVQAAAFAADGSAREAARAYVTAPDDETGLRRAAVAVQLAVADQGFASADHGFAVTCGSLTECLVPGREIRVDVHVRVLLPGVPRFVSRSLATEVTVRSAQVAVVDEFRVIGRAE